MKSVEDMLLQLILQGDSTYRCAAFRHHAAPHRAAPCYTHHHCTTLCAIDAPCCLPGSSGCSLQFWWFSTVPTVPAVPVFLAFLSFPIVLAFLEVLTFSAFLAILVFLAFWISATLSLRISPPTKTQRKVERGRDPKCVLKWLEVLYIYTKT